MESQQAVWDKEYSSHKNKWRRERLSFPISLKGKRILEVGCGNGKNLHSIFSQKPMSVVAIDFSEKAIEICKESFKGKKLDFVRADICNAKFESGSFDVILCYYVLNNLDEKSRIKAVNEMNRLLSDEGTLVFEDFAVGDARQKTKGKSTILKENGISCHFFTSLEVEGLFSQFSSVSLKQKSFSFLKSDPNLKRKIISAVAKK